MEEGEDGVAPSADVEMEFDGEVGGSAAAESEGAGVATAGVAEGFEGLIEGGFARSGGGAGRGVTVSVGAGSGENVRESGVGDELREAGAVVLDDGADGESGLGIGRGDGETLRESDVRRGNLRGCWL